MQLFLAPNYLQLCKNWRIRIWCSHNSTQLPAGWPRFHFRQGLRIFAFDTVSRPTLGYPQRPTPWVQWVFFRE